MWMPLRVRQDGEGFANSADNPGGKSCKSEATEPDSPISMRFYLCVFPIGLYGHGILLFFSANPENSVAQKETRTKNFFFHRASAALRKASGFLGLFPMTFYGCTKSAVADKFFTKPAGGSKEEFNLWLL